MEVDVNLRPILERERRFILAALIILTGATVVVEHYDFWFIGIALILLYGYLFKRMVDITGNYFRRHFDTLRNITILAAIVAIIGVLLVDLSMLIGIFLIYLVFSITFLVLLSRRIANK